jgi:hypothetical protein
VQVLVVDLHEDGAAFGEQFPRQKEPIAQVGQVGVDAQLPGVAIRLDLLWLVGEVFVFVFDIAAVKARLEVGGVFDAVGRVEVDHLYLACHALFDQQRVHHQQRVAQNESVCPVDLVLVELDLLISGQGRFAEQVKLGRLRAAHGVQNRPCGDALVNMERDDLHFE